MVRLTTVRRMGRYALWCGVVCAAAGAGLLHAETIHWPLRPWDAPHALGNSYGEYQHYGGSPYYHPGIDVMGDAWDSVFAVKSGYVKAVLTTSAGLHWRVAVGDSAAPVVCDGYLYAHLDETTIQVVPGDTVVEGQFLGLLVFWPVAEFHHLHFVKIRQSGYPWASSWQFIHDPLDHIPAAEDSTAPEFVPLANGQFVAFYPNNQNDYLPPGATLSGAVDFLVSVRDRVNHPTWWLTPQRVAYSFSRDSVEYGPFLSVHFRDTLWADRNVFTIYRDDAIYDSQGDYDNREYYIICTNNDNDEYIEPDDADSAWFTGDYPNGTYLLSVTANDRWGNRTDVSLEVVLENYFSLAGTVLLADAPSSHAGTVVRLPALGRADTTDDAGGYALDGIGPGSYEISVERPYYDTVRTTASLTTRDSVRNFVLQPILGLRGDLDHSGSVTATDIVLLVMYVFKSGPEPQPVSIGDANGVPPITSADIIYLVNYVFKGGPPPPPL